uniref:FLYWCH-type domain-containing protein n=1 Tax=Heterorhabditis bacteriophora TaxID=37862 RepID=A0A1I7X940_HETBA
MLSIVPTSVRIVGKQKTNVKGREGKYTYYISAEGQVRSAKLKCPNGRILHRPINKLYPMEIRATASTQLSPTPAELGDKNLDEEFDEEG